MSALPGIWILEAPPPRVLVMCTQIGSHSARWRRKRVSLERQRYCWKEERVGKDTDAHLGPK